MQSESTRVGWGRTILSSYWHWFDDPAANEVESDSPLECVCETIGAYKGNLIAEIARWESDPSICEICRDIRTARAEGRISKSEPMRLVAIVPPGLLERIRALMDGLTNVNVTSPPFYVALTQFRAEGVTKPFLSALLRRDAERAGKQSRIPMKWWDIKIEDIREVEGTTKVRIEREPKRVPRREANPVD